MPNIYVGTNNGQVTIDATNIEEYFTITNSTYYFTGTDTSFHSNNWNKDSTTAQTTLTAKVAMSTVSFNYSVSSESGSDKFTITVNGATVANGISGSTSSSWSGSLAAGKSIVFKYVKDSSLRSGDDQAVFSNMKLTLSNTVGIARVAKKIYIGVNGVAKTVKKMYIGVNGVARQCYPDLCDQCQTLCQSSCQSCDTCDSCDSCENVCNDEICETCGSEVCESCDSCEYTCGNQNCETCGSEVCQECEIQCETQTCNSCDTSCDICDTYCDICDDCDSGCDCTSDGQCVNGCQSCDHCDTNDSGIE